MGFIGKILLERNKKDEKMYLADGAIIFWNMRIMLKSISSLEIFVFSKMNPVEGIIVGILGVLLLVGDNFVIKAMGALFLITGIMNALVAIVFNLTMEHSLKIEMDSGKIFNFQSKDADFLRRVMEEIGKSIKDTQMRTYIDMSNNYIEQNVKEMKVEKLYKQSTKGGNIFNGNISFDGKNLGNIFMGKSVIHGDVTANENTDKSQQEAVLSETQWKVLEEFFAERLKQIGNDGKCYNNCNEMRKFSHEKNLDGLRNYMHSVGKTALSAVLGSAVGEGVKQILVKILRNG